MIEHKNTILAIVLSLIVVVGWQYFIGYPQMEKQRHDALLKQQQQEQVQARRSRAPRSPPTRQCRHPKAARPPCPA